MTGEPLTSDHAHFMSGNSPAHWHIPTLEEFSFSFTKTHNLNLQWTRFTYAYNIMLSVYREVWFVVTTTIPPPPPNHTHLRDKSPCKNGGHSSTFSYTPPHKMVAHHADCIVPSN